MKKTSLLFSVLLLGLTGFNPAALSSGLTNSSYLQRTEVQSFIKMMVTRHQFKPGELEQWFVAIHPRPDIIASISNPAEKKPWYEYRKIFLIEQRIKGGVGFWNQHHALLERAERETGVPARIIVAILGVETLYNRYEGRYPVMESLSTLAFDYPKRSAFFRGELEQFLLLAREEKVDPLSLKGSYAGAMGGPQFISSSFRRFAVDFDHDGKRDIWHNPADMIGSVANYFKKHKWQKNQLITVRARVDSSHVNDVINKGINPYYSLKELKKMGITGMIPDKTNIKAALIKLDGTAGPEYWLGMQNFYVITRYNHSPLYAMAVFQLSEAITKRMKKIN
ncbi:MAG TPA: lytic murein transglycosylase B [Gammaproteobacteria bacterium]|nr:lytic murein transglycosylase B [Gammaproteobacteria bacterium]